MNYYILASGSKGNATLIASGSTVVLIDMGLSLKRLKEKLKETPYSFEDIQAVFFTHEHTDHISNQHFFKIENVYSSQNTCELVQENILEPYKSYEKAGFRITVLPTSHDARNPIGFIFEDENSKLVYMTDTGYISERNMEFMVNADFYIIESNHNVKMLLKTERTQAIKHRILGDYGHLSNEDSALYISSMVGENTKEIVLAHISEEANTPELAVSTYMKIFQKRQINIGKISLKTASQTSIVFGGDEIKI